MFYWIYAGNLIPGDLVSLDGQVSNVVTKLNDADRVILYFKDGVIRSFERSRLLMLKALYRRTLTPID